MLFRNSLFGPSTLFSIEPLLVSVIAMAGLFFGVDDVRGALLLQLSGMVGKEGAETVAAGRHQERMMKIRRC